MSQKVCKKGRDDIIVKVNLQAKDLLCHSLMLLNVAYYAIDPPLLFHVILSINIKIMIIHFIKHYNNNIISLFWCIGALRTIQYSLP